MDNNDRQSRLFADVAERFARTVGRHNVKINFTQNYKVDQDTPGVVDLPYIPPGSTMSEGEYSRLSGYLDHETAKLRYSTGGFWEDNQEEMSEEGNELLSPLTSILESIRIENEYLINYPGARKQLDHITQDFNGYKHSQIREALKSAMDYVKILIVQEAYKHRNLDIDILDDQLSNYESLLDLIDIIDKIDGCQSTEDIYELVKEILSYLVENQEEIEEEVPTPDFGEGEDSEEGGDQNPLNMLGGGRSGDSENSDGDSDENSDLQDITIVVVMSKALNKSKGMLSLVNRINKNNGNVNLVILDADGDGDENPQNETNIPQRPKRDKLDPTQFLTDYEMPRAEVILPPYSTANDEIFVPVKGDLQTYRADSNYMKKQSGAIQQAVRQLLMSRDTKSRRSGLEDGYLDFDNALVEMNLGQKDVYYDKSETSRINTDVLLVVDLSGSMREHDTRRAVICLCDSLTNIKNVNLAIAGFTTGDRGPDNLYGEDLYGVGRLDSLWMPLFLDFDQAFYAHKAKLGSIQTYGATPLGEAYGLAIEKLHRRTTPRRAIWLVSDGHPTFACGDHRHDEHKLLEMCKKTATQLNIEVLGIGIGGSAQYLSRFTHACANITDIDNLVPQFIKMSKEYLSATRRR